MEEDHEEVEEGGAAGWPLGLLPVTLQMQQQLVSAFSAANLHPASHHTSAFVLATPTSCSSDLESSDLDTESSLFSFQARSVTLGSLMGIRSMTDPNLMRVRSLALARSCSQFSTLQFPSTHHQSSHVLELICRKLVNMQRHQFKRIATGSAKLCNNFFVRCTACLQAHSCRKQASGSSTSCKETQPMEDVANATCSLAGLLQMDRQSRRIMFPIPHRTVFIDIVYEGA